jgi:hypothetical protein
MSNTSVNIADDNRNNCLVTINYVNKYVLVLQIVNFLFCWQANKKYCKKILICTVAAVEISDRKDLNTV